MEFKRFTGGYMGLAYGDLSGIAAALRHSVPATFDTLVGTGLSGAVVVPRLADILDVRWCVVRKPNDSSHSSHNLEGDLGRRWLFVDDFTSTGATLKRTLETISATCDNLTRYNAEKGLEEPSPWINECVGVYEYQTNEYSTLQAKKEWCYAFEDDSNPCVPSFA